MCWVISVIASLHVTHLSRYNVLLTNKPFPETAKYISLLHNIESCSGKREGEQKYESRFLGK
jgi:hypothetical protein